MLLYLTQQQIANVKKVAQLTDLASRNIQRGRDHGLRYKLNNNSQRARCLISSFSDYNTYRKHFNFYDMNNLGIGHCLEECCDNFRFGLKFLM